MIYSLFQLSPVHQCPHYFYRLYGKRCHAAPRLTRIHPAQNRLLVVSKDRARRGERTGKRSTGDTKCQSGTIFKRRKEGTRLPNRNPIAVSLFFSLVENEDFIVIFAFQIKLAELKCLLLSGNTHESNQSLTCIFFKKKSLLHIVYLLKLFSC